MTTYDSNQIKLGKLGEKLVAYILNGQLSDDEFDKKKDMTILQDSVEVKTQVRYKQYGVFSIKLPNELGLGLNNLIKCLTVDRLIFVEYDETDFIKIYEMSMKNRKHHIIYTTASNKSMIGFRIDKMDLIDTIECSSLAEKMRKLSTSALYTK
jgi:hypothetical protein